jgi:hypothetical protein
MKAQKECLSFKELSSEKDLILTQMQEKIQRLQEELKDSAFLLETQA